MKDATLAAIIVLFTSGSAIAQVNTSPTSVNFDDQIIDVSSRATTIDLTNKGQSEVTFKSIAATHPFTVTKSTCAATLPAGESCLLSVNYTPTVLGQQTGTLTITDTASNSPQLVGLSGTGVKPVPRFVYAANRDGTLSQFAVNAATGELRPLSYFLVENNPDAVVLHPSGEFLYVGNSSTSNISAFRVSSTDGSLASIGGSPYSSAGAFSVVIHPSGKFLYSGGGLTTVSAFSINSVSGALTKISGSPYNAASFVEAIAADPKGQFLYVLDSGTDKVSVFRVNGSSGALSEVPSSPFPVESGPYSLSVSPNGAFLYVTNQLSGNVSAFTVNSKTGELTTVPGSPFRTGSSPDAIVIEPTGRYAYVANTGDGTISEFAINPSTGAFSALSGSPVGSGAIVSLAMDAGGRFVYGTDLMQGVFAYAIRSNGTLAGVPHSPYRARQPQAVAVSRSAAVLKDIPKFLYDAGGGAVGGVAAFTVNSSSGILTQIAGSPFQPASASYIATDPQGLYAYVPAPDLSEVVGLAIDQTNGTLSAVPGSPYITNGFPDMTGLDPTGRFLYATEATSGASNALLAYKINRANGALSAQILSPYACPFTNWLAFSPNGSMLYTTGGGTSIYAFSIDPAAGYLGVSTGFPFPTSMDVGAIAIHPTGKYMYLAAAGYESSGVWVYSLDNFGYPTEIGGPFQTGAGVRGAAIDPWGHFLFLANENSNNVSAYTIDAKTGLLTEVAGSPFPAGAQPWVLSVDPSGKFLYVANNASGDISAYQINQSTGSLTTIPDSPFPAVIAGGIAITGTLK